MEKRVGSIQALKYYSDFKNKETLLHATTWMNLEATYAKWKKPVTERQTLHGSFVYEVPEVVPLGKEVD